MEPLGGFWLKLFDSFSLLDLFRKISRMTGIEKTYLLLQKTGWSCSCLPAVKEQSSVQNYSPLFLNPSDSIAKISFCIRILSKCLHFIAIGNIKRHPSFVSNKSFLKLGDKFDASARIVEQLKTPLHVFYSDRFCFSLLAKQC